MTTNQLSRFALIRARIELECALDHSDLPRKFVIRSTLATIDQALKAIDVETFGKVA